MGGGGEGGDGEEGGTRRVDDRKEGVPYREEGGGKGRGEGRGNLF